MRAFAIGLLFLAGCTSGPQEYPTDKKGIQTAAMSHGVDFYTAIHMRGFWNGRTGDKCRIWYTDEYSRDHEREHCVKGHFHR